MAARRQRELVKIVATAVLIEREGDKIVGELTSDPVSAYDVEALQSVWAQAEVDVQAFNESQPGRSQRRRQ